MFFFIDIFYYFLTYVALLVDIDGFYFLVNSTTACT